MKNVIDLNTCSVAHDIQILCKLEHEVEVDTTSFYKEHNHQRREFCIVCHAWKDLSPCDNLDIGNEQNDTVMHAPEDRAFF